MRCRTAAAALVLSALLVGCSDDEPLPPAVLITTDPPVTTTAEAAPLESGTGPSQATSQSSSPDATPVAELSPDAVFGDISLFDASLAFVALSDVDAQRLEEALASDERVGPYLDAVEARALMHDGELVAIALALAVDPETAAAPGFSDTFLAGATSGGVADPLPLDVAGNPVNVWITDDTSSLVWVLENVYVVVTGRDTNLLRAGVDAMIRSALGLAPEDSPASPNDG